MHQNDPSEATGDEASWERQYAVLITDCDGFGESPIGDFDAYTDAYRAFEDAVRYIDELPSTVDDYPLTFDTVRLSQGLNLMHVWQRPPWRTNRLLREWSIRRGFGDRPDMDIRFAGVAVNADRKASIDLRPKPKP